jgi:hypothetical protein
MQRQNIRVPAKFIEYATVIWVVRFENKCGVVLEMSVRDRDESRRCTRRNQELQRRGIRIDLDVIETRNLLRHGFA